MKFGALDASFIVVGYQEEKAPPVLAEVAAVFVGWNELLVNYICYCYC